MKYYTIIDSGVEPLEVEPIVGIFQEVAIQVNKNIFPLAKAMVDDIWTIPQGLKLPFSQLIIGLDVNED